ncbi:MULTISPECIES: oxidoreductase [unclassified Streptomyces]|uniref:oxidoreductase n=1 Tax=unclassified Streptomyces TaxID=2593676 RepID=UPI001F034EE4|nr:MULTISPECIES: oxidoreductase [unclassified Streptomyces]MCH0562789.1 oxidoreductase [Streptomyces sp. MUM 2J]MCH0567700.1 oxidoreductase [Streptomyces sp. MUM 136J]
MTEGAGPRAGDLPDDLTAAEAGMWQAFRNGSLYDLRTGDLVVDDPHGGHPWGPERTVRARIVAWLLLDGPPALDGRVSSLKLTGVQIGGTLDLAGGTIAPYVEMRGCRFEREVRLPEAHFTTVRLVDCSVPRLEGARLSTEGDLHLPRCRFHNGVRLTDARIGTDLLLNQAVVHRDRNGRSISGDGMTVGQDLQAEMLEAHGELSLRSATVGVSLSLRGARLANPHARLALNAPQLTVERTLYLTPAGVGGQALSGTTPAHGTRVQHFECRGGVRLDDGRFGDAVDLEGARFTLTDEQELSLRRVQTPELRFLGDRPTRGTVVLSGARIVNLVDRAGAWPGPGSLHMGGFGYESLVPQGPFPLETRLGWIAAATAEYNPEPYERLAAVLRAAGEDEDARQVLLAKQRRRRETLPLAAKLWGYAQDWTVAYGYRPGRAAVWMAVLWAAGTLAFAHAHRPPARGDQPPEWNPALLALDLLLPVIDLGQAGRWQLGGGWQWLAAAMILLGWILATTVAAGATRALQRS